MTAAKATAAGTSSLPVATAVAAIRGGATTKALVDLTRVGLRLDSLESYTVIASIIIGGIMDAYSSAPKRGLTERKERVVQYAHAFFISLSFLAGLYVVLVFSMFNLYAKTALGTGADHLYLQLMQETGPLRLRAFHAFLTCLVGFEFALIANFFLNFKGKPRWIFSGLMTLGTIICLKEWLFIVRCATKCIFS